MGCGSSRVQPDSGEVLLLGCEQAGKTLLSRHLQVLAAATEKRDAVLSARVERAAELRTPRGGQSSNAPSAEPPTNGADGTAPADLRAKRTERSAWHAVTAVSAAHQT